MDKTTIRLAILTAISFWGYRMIKKYAFTKDETEIMYLAKTIWGEARGESLKGQQAVANVIMNRVKRGGWYGATVEEVVLKPYQFSCWNDTDPNFAKLQNLKSDDPQLATAKQIATKAYYGELDDITGGAVNYHAKSVTPYWAKTMTQTATIGNHIFYT